MTAGVIAAIAAGVLLVGALADRHADKGSYDKPSFKTEQHEKMHAPEYGER